MQAMQRRNAAASKARHMLKEQTAKAVKAVTVGGDLFQTMVRMDSEETLQKKLEPAVAEKIKDKLIDKLSEKFKAGLIEVSEIGEKLASRSEAVFGAIKGTIDERNKAQKELTVLQMADSVTASIMTHASKLEHALNHEIDGMSRGELAKIGGVLDTAMSATSDADSEENGKIADGMRDYAMTDLIGMPAGDLVESEEIAKIAYSEFEAEVRMNAMTANEAGKDIQHRLAHPNEVGDKLEKAEGAMGEDFQKDVKSDHLMRQRVASETAQ